MVAIGRPQGHRRCYKQWEEGGIAPQVVFEVLSPNNRVPEMVRKFKFYEDHGVDEYYLYDPDHDLLDGWQRVDGALQEIPNVDGWISPALGIRFDLSGSELKIFGPDGRRFLSYPELAVETDRLAEELTRAASERDQIASQRDQIASERDADRRRIEQLTASFVPKGSILHHEPVRSEERVALLRPGEVFEEIEAALARADQVEVAVGIDVDCGHLQPGAGRAGGKSLRARRSSRFLGAFLAGSPWKITCRPSSWSGG